MGGRGRPPPQLSSISVCDNDQNTISDKIQFFVVKTETMFVE